MLGVTTGLLVCFGASLFLVCCVCFYVWFDLVMVGAVGVLLLRCLVAL